MNLLTLVLALQMAMSWNIGGNLPGGGISRGLIITDDVWANPLAECMNYNRITYEVGDCHMREGATLDEVLSVLTMSNHYESERHERQMDDIRRRVDKMLKTLRAGRK